LQKAAELGLAVYPKRVERISQVINSGKFDDLSKFPDNSLTKEEIEWLRVAYSYPNGPILDPRPRKGAPKGIYYDEKTKQWKSRPYITIPG